MISIIVRAVAKPFYKAHAGFFFLLFFIAGGFMRSNEHITLAKYIARSDFLTVVLLLVFSLYQLKVWLFTKSLLSSDPFLFLRNIYLLHWKRQIMIITTVYLSINSVILIYGLFVAGFMIESGSYQKVLLILMYFVTCSALYTWAVVRLLKLPNREVRTNTLTSYLNKKIYKPYVFWYPIYLFTKRPILLALSKFLSIGLLIACFSTYSTALYDWRFLGISVVAAMSMNMVIVHSLFDFYVLKLSILKNLPLSSIKRVQFYLAIACLLLMPEIIIILRRLPVEAPNLYAWQAILYSIGHFLFYLHWTIYENADIERLGKFSLFSTLLQIYLVLFGVPLYGLVIIMVPFIWIAQKRYLVVHDY